MGAVEASLAVLILTGRAPGHLGLMVVVTTLVLCLKLIITAVILGVVALLITLGISRVNALMLIVIPRMMQLVPLLALLVPIIWLLFVLEEIS